jgi:hypothetical protein
MGGGPKNSNLTEFAGKIPYAFGVDAQPKNCKLGFFLEFYIPKS